MDWLMYEPRWLDMTDEQLACEAQAGCFDAFGELARRYSRRLTGFVHRRVGRWADAEDVAADAMTKALENITRYDGQSRFATWLFTIASRTAIDYQRRSARRNTGELPTDVQGSAADPADRAMADDWRQTLWATAERVLSESQYEALWLHYAQQMSVKEIARVLRRTTISTKVLLFRSRRALAPHVRDLAAGVVQPNESAMGSRTQPVPIPIGGAS